MIDILLWPAIIKILAAFIVIFLLSRRFPLQIGLLAAIILLGFSSDKDLAWIVSSGLKHIFASDSLWLYGIVCLILILSSILQDTGQLQQIVRSFEQVFSDKRIIAVILPSLIGLLPMPGGALFSAPMVEEALSSSDPQKKATPVQKMVVNYWFRHAWENWWPLYPGMILALHLMKVPAWQFLPAMLPLFFAAIIGGVLFTLSKIPFSKTSKIPHKKSYIELFKPIFPVVLLVAIFLFLLAFLEVIHTIFPGEHLSGLVSLYRSRNYFSFFVAVLASLLFLIWQKNISCSQIKTTVRRAKVLPLLSMIMLIMVFKGILQDSNIIEQLKSEFTAYHIPTGIIIGLVPFVAGAVIGLAVGFVGISFPLVLSLIPADHSLPYVVLAYSMGFLGMMVSPAHLCLVVTKEYFKADLLQIYGQILRLVGFNFLVTVLIFWVYFVL